MLKYQFSFEKRLTSWEWVENELRMGWEWVENELRVGWEWVENELRMGWEWVESGLRMGLRLFFVFLICYLAVINLNLIKCTLLILKSSKYGRNRESIRKRFMPSQKSYQMKKNLVLLISLEDLLYPYAQILWKVLPEFRKKIKNIFIIWHIPA